ncbi:Uncharacterised protein [Vibrio cholerae]|nr:Uncharacterised protein [Vibrio cholerae]
MKITFNTISQRFDGTCFRQPRRAFHQNMSISQQSNQQLVD